MMPTILDPLALNSALGYRLVAIVEIATQPTENAFATLGLLEPIVVVVPPITLAFPPALSVPETRTVAAVAIATLQELACVTLGSLLPDATNVLIITSTIPIVPFALDQQLAAIEALVP